MKLSLSTLKKWSLLLERWNVWVIPVSPLRFSWQKKRLALRNAAAYLYAMPQQRVVYQQMLRCLMLSGVFSTCSDPQLKRKAGVAHALRLCIVCLRRGWSGSSPRQGTANQSTLGRSVANHVPPTVKPIRRQAWQSKALSWNGWGLTANLSIPIPFALSPDRWPRCSQEHVMGRRGCDSSSPRATCRPWQENCPGLSAGHTSQGWTHSTTPHGCLMAELMIGPLRPFLGHKHTRRIVYARYL